MTEKNKGKTDKPEELHKVESKEVQKTRKLLQEAVVDSSTVYDVRKGIVSGSSVQQFRSQIEQTQQKQKTQKNQQKEKNQNRQ